MWPFEDELEIWFEEVDQQRKERYGVKDAHDDGQPMMQNELAKGRGR